MKHLIRKWDSWHAGCKRLGCIAGLEGGIVENMSKQELDDFFQGDCPYVFNPKKRDMSYKESVEYLLKRARKKINDWQRLMDYWEKKK